ncbi:hypothetical protein CFY87_00725 [Actinobacillus seminis]|uniref:Uncharacterized protein n=2 Tax=Actinobacillus seminis TaxID=722 RepID=A0ABX4FPJ7_9PAST|nr:hypothetical protein CFY87_00725 [Actinobacillus seminis]
MLNPTRLVWGKRAVRFKNFFAKNLSKQTACKIPNDSARFRRVPSGLNGEDMKMKKLLFLLWGLITTQAVHSAEISYINYDGMNVIVIAGPIISGDARKFKEIARKIIDGKAVVFFFFFFLIVEVI